MVAVFRRCSSPPAISSSYSGELPANHVRSVSVPCCSHPALSHLHDEIRSLGTLPPSGGPSSSAADWVADGLDRVGRVHAALDHLLHLPQSGQGTPIGGLPADRLLDDALFLADSYASLLSVVSELKHHASEARAAVRRGDSARLSAAVRCLRRVEKDLGRLAAGIKNLSKSSHPIEINLVADAAGVELAGVIKEAVAVTATATVAIVVAVETHSSSAVAASAATILKNSSAVWLVKRLTMPKSDRKVAAAAAEIEAHEKLVRLGKILKRVEEGGEKVFRKLVSTRVSLLNILAPSLL